jgi:dipeptidase
VCTTIVVGRNRSATGRVLVAHSEELGRNSAHRVSIVPARDVAAGERFPLHSGGDIAQPGRLARHVCTRIFDKLHYPGDHTSGINEHGVAVANNMSMMGGVPEPRMFDVVPGGVIWTEFLQLVLERATSAREGVALVGETCERHGLSCDSGTMIAVADADEAWWVELAREGHWAAQRVGDDDVSVRANCYRIPGFADSFGDTANQQDRYNLDRHDFLDRRLSALPTVRASALMAFLREVYEGTPLYLERPDGSPFGTGVRTIARLNTEACTVIEPRAGDAARLAHLMWCCLSTSLTGVFVPIHVGASRIEAHYARADGRYSPDSAYWLFAELAKLVDYRYRRCAELVRETWRDFEAETRGALAEVEDALGEAAACAGEGDRALSDLLTEFDVRRAAEAVRVLRDLLVEVKTRAFYED